MPEAVIVATARSPIGRAFKGSLKDLRPDDLAVQMVHAVLAKTPQLDHRNIEDLALGCAQPGGEAGYNLARVVAVLVGMDHLPGTTVNRFCASSLQARMAVHAVKAGEGDVFIAAGVEAVSRYTHGNADSHPGTEDPRFAATQARSRKVADGVLDWSDPRADGELPDIYVAMGHTAENVAALERVSRAEQDAYAVQSQNRAEKGIADGFWGRDITPVTLPDGTRVTADDCPRPGVTLEGVAALKPACRPYGTVTAGNACPLNDGAAASGMKRTVAARFVHNDRRVDALNAQAFTALSASAGARAYYDQQRAKGHGHNDALRRFANRLVGILHGCLKTCTLYDEDIAWGHRQQTQQAA